MNIIFIFSLFVLVKSEMLFLKDYRKMSQPIHGEIIQVISQIDGTEFYNMLKIPSDFSGVTQETVKDSIDYLHSNLEQLKLKFFVNLNKYVCDRLELYILCAIELVKKFENSTKFQEEVVNKIKFEPKNNCVVSFIFSMNNDSDSSFHAVYFLQSLSNNVKLNFITLLTRLQEIHKRLRNRVVSDVKSDVPQLAELDEDHSAKTSEELLARMTEIKNRVMELSNKFCSSSIIQPIIFKDLFVNNKDYQLHPFMKYVYSEEKCKNNVRSYNFIIIIY